MLPVVVTIEPTPISRSSTCETIARLEPPCFRSYSKMELHFTSYRPKIDRARGKLVDVFTTHPVSETKTRIVESILVASVVSRCRTRVNPYIWVHSANFISEGGKLHK